MVEQHYTPSQVSELLSRSRRTIYRDLYSGALRAKRCGRDWKIPESAIDEYIAIDASSEFEGFKRATKNIRSKLTTDQKMELVQVLLDNDGHGGEA